MILLCSMKCRPKKKRVSCFSPPMKLTTRFVIFYTDFGSDFLLLKFQCRLTNNAAFCSLKFALLFTATKLRQFSDFKLGITIPARGENSDLLNADEEKNDYDW
jgi:hypothetical protein